MGWILYIPNNFVFLGQSFHNLWAVWVCLQLCEDPPPPHSLQSYNLWLSCISHYLHLKIRSRLHMFICLQGIRNPLLLPGSSLMSLRWYCSYSEVDGLFLTLQRLAILCPCYVCWQGCLTGKMNQNMFRPSVSADYRWKAGAETFQLTQILSTSAQGSWNSTKFY